MVPRAHALRKLLPGLLALAGLACGKEEDPPPLPTCENKAAFVEACDGPVTKADLARVVGRWRAVTTYGGFPGCLAKADPTPAGAREFILEFFADGTYVDSFNPTDPDSVRRGDYVLGESLIGPAILDARDVGPDAYPLVSHVCGDYLTTGLTAYPANDGEVLTVYERQ